MYAHMHTVYTAAMVSAEDIRALRRDKYNDDPDADMALDITRLEKGEPLAYVIGWIPFLGLRINLDSHPLIPRPETEWWTEKLIEHIKEKYGDNEFSFLDLCAGSGATGLAVLKEFPNAHVAFAELMPEHCALICKNIEENGLDMPRASIYENDLFSSLPKEKYDIIATNPPYVPEGRSLDTSVKDFEPSEALLSGPDGLSHVRRIAQEAPLYIKKGGELWLECDSEHAETARALFGEDAQLHIDQYGRPRLVVSYY